LRRYFYGYNIVGAGAITQAVVVGVFFTYGIFFKEFQVEFGWSRTMVSGASSIAFLVMGLGAVVAGNWNDTMGPRILLSASALLLGIGHMLMSVIDSPWQLYLFYGGLIGFGYCTHDVITLSTVARWFEFRRGLMSGVVKMGTGAGQFIMPLAAAALISTMGWRQAYLLMGGVSMVVLAAVAQAMRRDPQDLGLQPDNREAPHRDRWRNRRMDGSFRTVARTRQFWIICFIEFSVFFCLFTTVVHIVPHAQDKGLATTVAAGVLSAIGAVSILGRFIMGMVNDRIGGRRSLLACFILLISSLVFIQIADRAWMFFLFASIYGFAHGGFFTVMSPTIAELYGTGSHGQLFGVVFFFGTIGGSIGPMLTGYIFDIAGSYRMAFMVLTIFAIIGFILILKLRTPSINTHVKLR
jgi:MFS family permease